MSLSKYCTLEKQSFTKLGQDTATCLAKASATNINHFILEKSPEQADAQISHLLRIQVFSPAQKEDVCLQAPWVQLSCRKLRSSSAIPGERDL